MAGKRVSLASLAGAKVETVPGAGRPDLVHVHPDTVAPTPLNPRLDFDQAGLTELGEDMRSGQLQPCVAVAKAAYLKLYPEHADQLPDGCRYVMAAGERRWRAALVVGLDTLDVLLRHDLTESRIRFLSAVLSENVQRENFNPIEEANGLRAMLDLHDGNQSSAAKAMGKSKQWFGQRIGLLRLTDEMVQLVLDGKLTAFREMRRYAAMLPDQQYPAWKADQERPPAPRITAVPEPTPPEPVRSEPAAAEEAEGYTAVYTPPPSPAPAPATTPAPAPEGYTAVYTPPAQSSGPAVLAEPTAPAAQSSQGEAVPEPRRASASDEPEEPPTLPGIRFPYEDSHGAAQYLIHKMPKRVLDELTDLLVAHREKRAATAR
jgi:ParB family chromosome partitioning protein